MGLEPSSDNEWERVAELAVERLLALVAQQRVVACNVNVPARWNGSDPVPATRASAGRVTAAVADDRFSFERATADSIEPGSDVAFLAEGRARPRCSIHWPPVRGLWNATLA